jgi:hypothetical protein
MIMLEHALPSGERDEFTKDSEVNPVTVFHMIRDKWLINGEGTAIFISIANGKELHSNICTGY